MTDAVAGELKPKVESVDWAELSRSKRKTEWLRLCLSAVKRLERLLGELKAQRRTEEDALIVVDTTRMRRDQQFSSVKRNVDVRVDDHTAKKENRRNRARRLAASAVKRAKPSMGTAISRKVRKVIVDSRSANLQTREQEQPTLRIRRLRIREAVEQKHLATRNDEQAPLRIRRLGISEAVEKKRLEARLAATTERTQQHTKRQQLRSRRRMQRLCTRMAWDRHIQEKTAAGDELWQQAQQSQHDNPKQGNVWAWPRLAQWQREQLTDEVQAFVSGSR